MLAVNEATFQASVFVQTTSSQSLKLASWKNSLTTTTETLVDEAVTPACRQRLLRSTRCSLFSLVTIEVFTEKYWNSSDSV